jgi:hypothetical protein
MDGLREQLIRVVEILQPYARSVGAFHNIEDVKTAIALATLSLRRANRIASKLPPTRRENS